MVMLMLWFNFASLRARLIMIGLLAILPMYLFLLDHLQNISVVTGSELMLPIGAIAIIWLGCELLYFRWVRLLMQVTNNLAAGDFQLLEIDSLLHAPTEIKQLAQTFNQIATSQKQQSTQAQHLKALTKANERFELATTLIDAVIYDWDIEHDTIERTVGLVDVLGYRPEDVEPTYDWWCARIHPEDKERVIATFADALANGCDYAIEYRIRHQQNHYLYIWDRGLIVRNAQGQAIRVVGSGLNITERKQMEEELQKSEQRFRQIAENMREVLWISTPGAEQLIYVNPAYEKIWEQSCESLYAQPLSFVDRIHPEDRDQVTACFSKKEFQAQYNKEYRIVKPDNSILWMRSRAFPILNQQGQVYRIAGLVEDITQRKRVEAEIKQLNETLEQRVKERTAQLEAANRELDAFAYSVSHDLRAPLRHVRGFVDALALQLEQSGAITSPKVSHYIRVIQDSSLKMGQLIDALLVLSRVGRQPVANCAVNLRQLVDAAIALVQDQITDDHLAPEFIVGDLPTVNGDPTLLQQVFSNLIDNAVKFSCYHQPSQITIGFSPCKTIFVKDNGVGFQREYADQIFGAFQRLHSPKEFSGIGIGLAIVQRIIQRHGGTIWAESAPNQGATFYFKLGHSEEQS